MAAGGEHNGSRGPGALGELGRQPRLADAGLALDHHQGAVGLGVGIGVQQRRQLLVAADERQLGGRSGAGARAAGAGGGPGSAGGA